MSPQEQESWQVKVFSAENVQEFIKDARADFAAECRAEDRGECVVCHAGRYEPAVPRVQHWNDAGGPDTLECEWCWVLSIVDFWMQERVSETNPTTAQGK